MEKVETILWEVVDHQRMMGWMKRVWMDMGSTKKEWMNEKEGMNFGHYYQYA